MIRKSLFVTIRMIAASLAFLLRAHICIAQTPPPACQYLLDMLAPPQDAGLTVQLKAFTDIGASPTCFWQLVSNNEELTPSFIRSAYKAQKQVNTTQAGAPSGSGGTTSAVSKPITPLSLATEYGGITSSTNAQTVTLQAPLDGIPRALATHGDISYCSTPLVKIKGCIAGSLLDKLDRFGVGVSLNTATASKNISGTATGSSQGSTQQVALSSVGSKVPSLASVFTKITLIRGAVQLPDPKTINAKGESNAVAALLAYLDGNQNYTEWRQCVEEKLEGASPSERVAIFNRYYTQVRAVLLSGAKVDCTVTAAPALPLGGRTSTGQKQFFDAVQAYIAEAELTQATFDAAVAKATSAPVLSIEYDFNTPQNQPTNSTAKLVGSFSWPHLANKPLSSASTAPWTLTYNGGVSLYNSTPASTIPGASVLRDVQIGVELDRSIASSKLPGLLGKIGDTTASVTYYFQYQSSPSILNVTPSSPLNGITITGLPSSATQVFTTKGNINVAQLKYGFGKGKNVKFPVAVTYSNRTELIAHPTWGLQFGVSYDFSSLMGSGSNK
jgi:hypothetical protein